MIGKEKSKKGKNKDYEDQIVGAIGKKEFAKLSRGYDLLGDIAIIGFEGSKKSEKKIAKLLMETNSNIKTVLAKSGAVSGKYRIRKVRYVAGSRNFVASYKENNCTFKFDVRKVYFSNRLSFERSRILKLIKKKEAVMVMFAGVGPFAIEIAKILPDTNVVAIELNKYGYKYMLENIKLNKTSNVKAVLGDVKKKVQDYKNFADRIIMPLPKSSIEFLDSVYKTSKKSAVVHLYAFSDAKDPFKDVLSKVKIHAKKNNYSIKLLDKRIVRPYSSKEYEIVLDYLIKKGTKS